MQKDIVDEDSAIENTSIKAPMVTIDPADVSEATEDPHIGPRASSMIKDSIDRSKIRSTPTDKDSTIEITLIKAPMVTIDLTYVSEVL